MFLDFFFNHCPTLTGGFQPPELPPLRNPENKNLYLFAYILNLIASGGAKPGETLEIQREFLGDITELLMTAAKESVEPVVLSELSGNPITIESLGVKMENVVADGAGYPLTPRFANFLTRASDRYCEKIAGRHYVGDFPVSPAISKIIEEERAFS